MQVWQNVLATGSHCLRAATEISRSPTRRILRWRRCSWQRRKQKRADRQPLRKNSTGFLILVFIEEEVLLGRIVRPDLFDALVWLSVVFKLLKIFDNFEGSARPDRKVD